MCSCVRAWERKKEGGRNEDNKHGKVDETTRQRETGRANRESERDEEGGRERERTRAREGEMQEGRGRRDERMPLLPSSADDSLAKKQKVIKANPFVCFG